MSSITWFNVPESSSQAVWRRRRVAGEAGLLPRATPLTPSSLLRFNSRLNLPNPALTLLEGVLFDKSPWLCSGPGVDRWPSLSSDVIFGCPFGYPRPEEGKMSKPCCDPVPHGCRDREQGELLAM